MTPPGHELIQPNSTLGLNPPNLQAGLQPSSLHQLFSPSPLTASSRGLCTVVTVVKQLNFLLERHPCLPAHTGH